MVIQVYLQKRIIKNDLTTGRSKVRYHIRWFDPESGRFRCESTKTANREFAEEIRTRKYAELNGITMRTATRNRRMPTAFLRKDGNWSCYLHLGINEDGKAIRKYVTARTKQESIQALRDSAPNGSVWIFQDHRQKQKLGDACHWSVGWLSIRGKRCSVVVGDKSYALQISAKLHKRYIKSLSLRQKSRCPICKTYFKACGARKYCGTRCSRIARHIQIGQEPYTLDPVPRICDECDQFFWPEERDNKLLPSHVCSNQCLARQVPSITNTINAVELSMDLATAAIMDTIKEEGIS